MKGIGQLQSKLAVLTSFRTKFLGWPKEFEDKGHLVSLVQDWKELVSLGPNLGHLVSLDQVSFGWPKQSQARILKMVRIDLKTAYIS